MIAALVLGLDDQGSALGRDLGAKARPGDSAADNDNIESGHCKIGYELESRAV
jgi:hypothetical protein